MQTYMYVLYMHVRILVISFPVPKRAEMRAGNEAIVIHV